MKSSSEHNAPQAPASPTGLGASSGRTLGLVLTLLLVLLVLRTETAWERGLRNSLFDTYQQQFPRERVNDSVIVIAIDDLSLQKRGQWPWPRKDMAELINRLHALKPAAIGIDMIFAEPDRISPRAQAQQLERQGYVSRELPVARLPDYDQQFAQAIRDSRATLGVAGVLEDPRLAETVDYRAPLVEIGGKVAGLLPRYDDVLRSLALIDRAAAGHGMINAIAEDDGMVRRVPALAQLGGYTLPGLAVEVLRHSSQDPVLRARVGRGGVRAVEVGGQSIPTAGDGSWWIHFSDPNSRPIFPAVAFLDGQLPGELVTGRIVLIGAAATGLQDRVVTPLGAMPGVSVHAEAIDNLLDGRLLWRPHWSVWVEGGLLAVLSLLSVLAVPSLRPLISMLWFGLAIVACATFGAFCFLGPGWLIDVANPVLAAGVVFAFMLLLTLGQTQRQRRSLRMALAVSREQQARMDGELDAARRIQSGMLPDPRTVLAGESRVDLAALMQAARTVGGDLYDFFRLDDGRLFFMIGDVSGKGLPASLFMALSKALIKNAALNVGGDPGRGLSEAARVLARENPESMFISVVAGALNLDTGELAWCNAGHEGPYLVRAGEAHATQLKTEGGPPLCMVEGFSYPTEFRRLGSGDLLCLVTDGVTEALNASGELYGARRLADAVGATGLETSSRKAVDRLRRDVEKFTGGLELADDLSLLVLRWRGKS